MLVCGCGREPLTYNKNEEEKLKEYVRRLRLILNTAKCKK
jgi:hypothetical protein